MKKIFLLVFLLVFSITRSQTTYYVDSASDGGDGTTTATTGTQAAFDNWDDFNRSAGTYSSGDSILFKKGDTFAPSDASNAFQPSSMSGVIFGSYGTGNRPKIDGEGSTSMHIGFTGTTSDLYFVGLHFMTSSANSGHVLAMVSNYADGITFDDCEIDGTNQTVGGVGGETFSGYSDDITFVNCEIHTGPRTGIYFAGGENNIVDNCTIYGFPSNVGGVKFNHMDQYSKYRGVVRNSNISNCINGVVVAGSDSILIHNNVFSPIANQVGINIIQDPEDGGHESDYTKIYNNTFIMIGNGSNSTTAVQVRNTTSNTDVKNNIMYVADTDNNINYMSQRESTAGIPTYDYNLYYSENYHRWKGSSTTYTSLTTWQATGQDGSSTIGNPDFISNFDDLNISTVSPAKNAGTTVYDWDGNALDTDILGNPIIGAPDLGAYELQYFETATNYYVKSDGNDSYSGLDDANAWRTIEKIIAFTGYNEGDIVYFKRGHTFYSTDSHSGELRAMKDYFTYDAYGTGDRPIISGNTIYKAWDSRNGSPYNTYPYHRDHVTIKNLRFQDGNYANHSNTCSFGDANLTLINCIFDGDNSFENVTYGKTTGEPDEIYGLVVQNCTFQNTKSRAGLYINDVYDVLIENSIFINNHGSDFSDGAEKWEGSGLKFNHNCTVDIIIRNNWFENNHFGLRCGAIEDGMFYNNVVITEDSPTGSGIALSFGVPDLVYDQTERVDGIRVYYNTIVVKGPASSGNYNGVYISDYGALGTSPPKGEEPRGIEFDSNIFYYHATGGGTEKMVEVRSTAISPVSDYNLWWVGTGDITDVLWQETGVWSSPYTFARWQSEGGHDANGEAGPPLFTDYASKDFTLTSLSNAIDLGTPLTDYDGNPINTDILGNARSATTPTAGAYEYGSIGGTEPPDLPTSFEASESQQTKIRLQTSGWDTNTDSVIVHWALDGYPSGTASSDIRGNLIDFEMTPSGSTMPDQTANSNDGTIYGTPSTVTGGLNFDGTDDRIVVSDDATLDNTEFTLIVKLKAIGDQVDYANLFNSNNGSNGYDIRYRGGTPNRINVRVGDGTSTQDFYSNDSTKVGIETDLAVTYDGAYCKFYFDGVLDVSVPVTIGTLQPVAGNIAIGGSLSSTRYFEGEIYDFQLFDHAITADSILAYTTGVAESNILIATDDYTDLDDSIFTNVLWTYEDTVYFSMWASDAGEWTTTSKQDTAAMKYTGTAPVAAFSANDVTPTTLETVTFTDASTNTPTHWLWDITPTTITYMSGTSASADPQIRFDNPGTYDVALKATNAGGWDWETKIDYITATGTGGVGITDITVDGIKPATIDGIKPAAIDGVYASNESIAWYVSTTGDDNDDGTSIEPFLTIQKAYTMVKPGDSIYVDDGVYQTTGSATVVLEIHPDGTSSNPIVLQSINRGGAVIDGQQLNDGSHDICVYFYGDYNVIDGFRITGGSDGGVYIKGIYNIVKNCEIDSNGITGTTTDGQSGVYSKSESHHNVYTRNYVHHNGRRDNVYKDHGFYLSSPSDSIMYNIIVHNATSGIQLAGGDNTNVLNNTIARNATGINMTNFPIDSVNIRNNIFYENDIRGYTDSKGFAIHAGTTISNVHIYDNLFKEPDGCDGSEGCLWNFGYNWGDWSSYADTSNVHIHSTTLFVDDSTNFTLADGTSLAIDNAYDWGQSGDYNDSSKADSEWEIGAIEYYAIGEEPAELIASDSNRTFQWADHDWANNTTATDLTVNTTDELLTMNPELTYTSDWSSAADGWGSLNGTLNYNIDGISDGSTSYDNTLRYYAAASALEHWVSAPNTMYTGDTIREIYSYYIPSNTSLDGFVRTNGYTTTLSGTSDHRSTTNGVVGTWTETWAVFYDTPAPSTTRFSTRDAAVSAYTGAGSVTDDLIYIYNYRSYEWFVRYDSKIILDNAYIGTVTTSTDYIIKVKLRSDDLIDVKFGFGNIDTTVTTTATSVMYEFTDTYSGSDTEDLYIQPLAPGFVEVDSVSFQAAE